MKIVIPGGSGQAGTILARAFHHQGNEVVVLSRSRQLRASPWRTVVWDGATLGDWVNELEGAGVVINLAGRSVNCRYTAENRRAILDSRVISTHTVGQAIARSKKPPKVWLQAGTSTIYSHRHDASNDEESGQIDGSGPDAPVSWLFSGEVAEAWEGALDECEVPFTRKVVLRLSMIMSPDRGGVFATLLGLVRLGLGGTFGSGKQYVSWVHEADFVRAVAWLIDHNEVAGPVNVTSPHPLPNLDFMRGLRRAWGIPFGLPAARWMLEIGGLVLKTEPELILKSRRVVPGRLLDGGFRFEFSEWPQAATDLCRRWREARLVVERAPYRPRPIEA